MKKPNREIIKEWVDKAQGDYEAALILNKNRRKKKTYFIIAFHCQQAIEKYLKALLVCRGLEFKKTHDLVNLLDLLTTKDALLAGIKSDLDVLTPFAVKFRYPGEDIEPQDLKEAIKVCKRVRKILQKRLGEFL